MKILIINQHTNNFGDDIAALALIDNLLLHKDVELISIIYNTPGKLNLYNKRVEHDIELTLKNIGIFYLGFYFMSKLIGINIKGNNALKNFLFKLKDSDYIFVSPSGANIGIYKDWRYLLKVLIVCLEGYRPIFYLNTIGKSNNILFNNIAKYVLKRSKLYVREKASFDYLMGIGQNSTLGVDAAFGGKKLIVDKKYRIGFIPTQLSTWHPLYKKIDITEKIREEIINPMLLFAKQDNLEIVLIPHLCSLEEELLYDEIYKYIKEKYNNITKIIKLNDANDYEKEIASCRYIFGMRYHSIVLAAKNAVPFISIAYENKMKEVCDYTNMNDYLIELYNFGQKYNFYEMATSLKHQYDSLELNLRNLNDSKLYINSTLPLDELWGQSNIKKQIIHKNKMAFMYGKEL